MPKNLNRYRFRHKRKIDKHKEIKKLLGDIITPLLNETLKTKINYGKDIFRNYYKS